ncbi:hypothetical protein DRJ48_01140 [Candidatus Woesearchaeota archaeon]|nr:hypothetical protein [Candidatus Woesearchaeota archaeon]RLE43377.1 MAG: hypothetical protein DRJ48_01140 [Candidatus Woesearchaeota archaeon]
MNKRGISPLIATVVLIAFAVALGAVIMNWGSHLVESSSNQSLKCSDLSFSIHPFPNGGYDICYDNNTLKLTLESYKGRIDNVKLIAYTKGDKLFTVKEILSAPLEPGEPQRVVLDFNRGEYGDILDVQLYPIIGRGEKAYLCKEAPVSFGEVRPCS